MNQEPEENQAQQELMATQALVESKGREAAQALWDFLVVQVQLELLVNQALQALEENPDSEEHLEDLESQEYLVSLALLEEGVRVVFLVSRVHLVHLALEENPEKAAHQDLQDLLESEDHQAQPELLAHLDDKVKEANQVFQDHLDLLDNLGLVESQGLVVNLV